MTKYMISLLVSSNLNIFKYTFESVINQINYDDFDIFIIVNTLDELFYNKLINFFKNKSYKKLKKIIRTESNGKPGKGYNSVFNLFKNNINYNYLIFMDGDDFLYPEALYKINDIVINKKPDIIQLAGCTKINIINKLNRSNNKDYSFISKINFEEYKVNRFSKDFNKVLATPSRLFLIHKNIFKYYDYKLYNENMFIYADYKSFLISYKEFFNNRLNVLFLSNPYIYLYNNSNISSLSKTNNTKKINYDEKNIEQVYKQLTIDKDNLKIETIKIECYNEQETSIITNFYEKLLCKVLQFQLSHYICTG